jgi:hypothetical protein
MTANCQSFESAITMPPQLDLRGGQSGTLRGTHFSLLEKVASGLRSSEKDSGPIIRKPAISHWRLLARFLRILVVTKSARNNVGKDNT